MSGLDHPWATRVLSGEERGLGAASLRALTAIAEPFYSLAMMGRNLVYDRGLLKIHPLPRPTISIGNLTTGGTGKTPVVRWLSEHLISRGLRPAVLLRGYRDDKTGGSDEANLLAEALGDRGIVVADRNRDAGARLAMAGAQPPDVFLLDDAFQHRRVVRDFDLVLIDATQPFGYGHVLPRGLMREPLRGLRRADAIVITRSDQISAQQLDALQADLRQTCKLVPIYLARHVNTALRPSSGPDAVPISELSRQKFLAFAGIANPRSLRQQLDAFGGNCVDLRAFGDHHAYTTADLADLQRDARAAGASMLLTTEKDWVKVRTLAKGATDLPFFRLDLRVEFQTGDEERLLRQVMDCLQKYKTMAIPVPTAR